jgi:organic hydroperoxide reductase OsmC/OhrA
MSEHKAVVKWASDGGDFLKGRFSRKHTWSFDGGITVPASPAPAVVPAPYSDEAAVDPEEAYVASISSCHMLTFLFLAFRKGFEVVRYEDEAVGAMGKAENGVPWVESITLSPSVEYGGEKRPTPEEEEQLHHGAHTQCFIANSVKTAVHVGSAGT